MRTGARAASVIAVLAILPSCAGRPSRSDVPDVASGAPDVARIVCSEDGTRVETPTVRAQPDGVHVTVDNRLGFHTGFSMRFENGGGGGRNAPRGESAHVLSAPPGRLEIGCYTDRDALAPDLQALRVVDPTGIYRSTELDCERIVGENVDFASGTPGVEGDPVEIARDDLGSAVGLRADDVVELAGYPEDEPPTVRLVRDGRVVATISYFETEQGGWLQDSLSRCDELVR